MKAKTPRDVLLSLAVGLFGCLLRLYPTRFRAEFSGEIQAVFLRRIGEAQGLGGMAWLASVSRETRGLLVSILIECWHERRSRKEKNMLSEDKNQASSGPGRAGGMELRPASEIGLRWIAGWTLLMTAAIPAALVAMTPLAVALLWMLNLGVRAGLWPPTQLPNLQPLGFITVLALCLSSVQWYWLRYYLPRARLWFLATGAGVLLGGFSAGLILFRPAVQTWQPVWIVAAMLLPVGLFLGLAQWLHLRRYLPGAFWIILIDVLAAIPLLVMGGSIGGLVELAAILILPGLITGIGIWLLLRRAPSLMQTFPHKLAAQEKRKRVPRLGRIGLALAALVPLFFLCSWVYAASHLVLAKNEGIYNTPEEAVIARNNQGFGGAEVLRIEGVWARPNNGNAASPVWFGGGTVYMDRVPQGYSWTQYSAGSYYLRVREGWVHVGEGAFPEFIGWVMKLYNMEGVR